MTNWPYPDEDDDDDYGDTTCGWAWELEHKQREENKRLEELEEQ